MTHALQALMQQVNGSSFVAIDTSTEPTLRGGKANPFKGRVRKISKGNVVMVFQNKNSNGYQNMVMKRLALEGKDPESFQIGERTWGTRIKDTPFVEHNGAQYLEVIFLKSGTTTYECDGAPINKEDIEGLVETVQQAEQGGLDNKVIIRTFKFDSITSLTIGKQKYDLTI